MCLLSAGIYFDLICNYDVWQLRSFNLILRIKSVSAIQKYPGKTCWLTVGSIPLYIRKSLLSLSPNKVFLVVEHFQWRFGELFWGHPCIHVQYGPIRFWTQGYGVKQGASAVQPHLTKTLSCHPRTLLSGLVSTKQHLSTSQTDSPTPRPYLPWIYPTISNTHRCIWTGIQGCILWAPGCQAQSHRVQFQNINAVREKNTTCTVEN